MNDESEHRKRERNGQNVSEDTACQLAFLDVAFGIFLQKKPPFCKLSQPKADHFSKSFVFEGGLYTNDIDNFKFNIMHKLTRKEFANQAEEYIKRLNEIAEKQGFSVITAFYIEGSDTEPSDCIIDWRNMSLDENLYAIGRFTQDIMNSYDEESKDGGGAPFSDYGPGK